MAFIGKNPDIFHKDRVNMIQMVKESQEDNLMKKPKNSFNSFLFFQPIDQFYEETPKMSVNNPDKFNPNFLSIEKIRKVQVNDDYEESLSTCINTPKESYTKSKINDFLKAPLNSLLRKNKSKIIKNLQPDWQKLIESQKLKTMHKLTILTKLSNHQQCESQGPQEQELKSKINTIQHENQRELFKISDKMKSNYFSR
jgi:hypothetical protein